jgi:aminopeptidase N
MRFIYQTIISLALLLLLSSCGVFGIHFKVKNPKHAGTYPKETKKLLLLGARTKYRTCFDVHYYALNVNINPKKKYISGNVIINATAVNAFDTFQLDLYKNLKLTKIEIDGQAATYIRKEGAIFIHPTQNLQAGSNFSIQVWYDGKPIAAKRPPWRGGSVWKYDKNKSPWDGVACETEGASLWWPNKEDVADEADSADVSLTVPANLMAVSNGVLKDSSNNQNNTCTYRWHISYPINNYNITFYLGNFKLLKDEFVSKVNGRHIALNYYVLPYNYDKALAHFQQVKTYLAFYEEKFGPYPWPDDGFKLVESPIEGMEHQTAIAYGSKYKNDYYGFDYIILHETAHEWWGNSVTASDMADAWLHEGFASYTEALYVERTQGYEAYLDYMYGQRIFILNKRAVVRKRGIRYFDYHDEDIYNKGSWVLHSLRYVINNDSLFFNIIKTFRMENHQKQILSETFIETVNRLTGHNYNWFFNQYLYKREAPILEYRWLDNYFYYRWTNVDPEFNKMPVEVTINGEVYKVYPSLNTKYIPLSEYGGNYQFTSDDKAYYGLKFNKHLE